MTLLGTGDSEPLAVPTPFFAQQIFNDSLYLNFGEVGGHLRLLDGLGHEQIGSAAGRLWITPFTPVNSPSLMGEGGGEETISS